MKPKRALKPKGRLRMDTKVESSIVEKESVGVATLKSPLPEEKHVALVIVESPVNESVGLAVVESPVPENESAGTIMEIDESPSHDEIAVLAYSYWDARGRQGGSAEEDWLQAERELRGQRAGGKAC